jgi:hypothetical protein
MTDIRLPNLAVDTFITQVFIFFVFFCVCSWAHWSDVHQLM